MDLHTPDFLFLTETPLAPNNGALTHILRNRGYKLNYQPVNTLKPQDTLPAARLTDHLTHSGGGCWIAYRKYTSWVTHVRPLRLPTDCPLATTCAVEVILHSAAKAIMITSYLRQLV